MTPRYLRKHPLGEEIVVRLRHRWTPDEVADWLVYENSKYRAVDVWLLEAFTAAQDETWYVPLLREGGRRTGLLALSLLEDVIVTQTKRIKEFLTVESTMGVPIPEVRSNIEALGRMLVDYLTAQQKLGLLPTVPQKLAVAMGGTGATGDDDEFVRWVRRTSTLDTEDFVKVLTARLGPPKYAYVEPGTTPP